MVLRGGGWGHRQKLPKGRFCVLQGSWKCFRKTRGARQEIGGGKYGGAMTLKETMHSTECYATHLTRSKVLPRDLQYYLLSNAVS